jgi:diaminohydroxyphosphoribosylaminopyrimidine deaminase / 5-amino-6-(5-phosphoribosylamino)uracil reductase
MAASSPVRIVLDSRLRLPLDSRLVRSAREVPVWVVAGTAAPPSAEEALTVKGVTVLRVADTSGPLDLAATLKLIAARGITRLMVEGGPRLATALLAADLIDEAVLFDSPKRVGADGIDALEGMPLAALTESPRLKCVTRETVGADVRAVFERR